MILGSSSVHGKYNNEEQIQNRFNFFLQLVILVLLVTGGPAVSPGICRPASVQFNVQLRLLCRNKIHEEENLVTQAEGGTQRGSCSQGKTRNLASSVCDKYVTLSLHTRAHSIQSIVLECLTTTNTFHPYTNLHIHSLASRAGAAPTVLQKLVSLVFWGCRRPLSLAGMSIL